MKLIYKTCLGLILSLTLTGIIFAQLSERDRRTLDQDVRELERLIGEGEKKAPAPKRGLAMIRRQSFYRKFGKDVSIRGDGKFIYIKAGPTSVIIDAKGRVQIKSAANLFMQSKKSIYLQADENINLIAGGEIVKSKLTPLGYEPAVTPIQERTLSSPEKSLDAPAPELPTKEETGSPTNEKPQE